MISLFQCCTYDRGVRWGSKEIQNWTVDSFVPLERMNVMCDGLMEIENWTDFFAPRVISMNIVYGSSKEIKNLTTNVV